MKLNHKKLNAFLKASPTHFETHLVQEGIKSFLIDEHVNENMKEFLTNYGLFEEDVIEEKPNHLLELINLLGIQITNKPNFQIDESGLICEPNILDQRDYKLIQTGTMIFNSVEHFIEFLKSTLKTKWEVTTELTTTNIYLMQDFETGLIYKSESFAIDKISVRLAIVQAN